VRKERERERKNEREIGREGERGRREYMVKESAKPSYSVSARAGIERREREKERKIESIESESSIC